MIPTPLRGSRAGFAASDASALRRSVKIGRPARARTGACAHVTASTSSTLLEFAGCGRPARQRRRIVSPQPRGGVIDATAPLPQHMQQSWNLLGLDAARFDPIENAPEE